MGFYLDFLYYLITKNKKEIKLMFHTASAFFPCEIRDYHVTRSYTNGLSGRGNPYSMENIKTISNMSI